MQEFIHGVPVYTNVVGVCVHETRVPNQVAFTVFPHTLTFLEQADQVHKRPQSVYVATNMQKEKTWVFFFLQNNDGELYCVGMIGQNPDHMNQYTLHVNMWT